MIWVGLVLCGFGGDLVCILGVGRVAFTLLFGVGLLCCLALDCVVLGVGLIWF